MLLSEQTKIIDISIPLNEKTIIYPGNTSIVIKTIKNSSSTSVSSEITIGSHTGTHIDAPSHVIDTGLAIDKLDLHKFIGSCRVVDIANATHSITKEDIMKKHIKPFERVLLKTANSLRGFKTFYDDYIFLSPEASDYLANLPVTCIGIDSLSIKQKGSKDTTPHTAFLLKNIPIIEGLDLSNVSEGTYTLLALPLAFTGIDGSPARVVLIESS